MRYIKEDSKGFTSYDAYFEYLELIKKHLDDDIYRFASDVARHDLHSKESLHDSWLKQLRLNGFYEGVSKESHDPAVELVLLGPHHDRLHTLRYFDVERCDIDFRLCNDARRRDLLAQEIRYNEGCLEHEFEFDGKMKIEIICRKIQYQETFLKV